MHSMKETLRLSAILCQCCSQDVKINEKGNLTELLNISAGLQIG